MTMGFSCLSECGWCCTHLTRERTLAEATAEHEFTEMLRTLGVYTCRDRRNVGLVLTSAEAGRLGAIARERKIDAAIHPHTFSLDEKRKETLVFSWHFPHESCIFYADYACTVYADRPLPCRAFPVLNVTPRWGLAKTCPKVPEIGRVEKPVYFAKEAKARRALDAARVAADESLQKVLNDASRKLAMNLTPKVALARARRYRLVAA